MIFQCKTMGYFMIDVVVAVACKIIRVFYTILTKGVDYDANKLMGDIRRPQVQTA